MLLPNRPNPEIEQPEAKPFEPIAYVRDLTNYTHLRIKKSAPPIANHQPLTTSVPLTTDHWPLPTAGRPQATEKAMAA